MLLVEQNAAQALKRADTAPTSSRPARSCARARQELASDPAVKAAYLGGDV